MDLPPIFTGNQIPTYRGELLFINQSAEKNSELPNQHAVFSHIQSRYRKWHRHILKSTKTSRLLAFYPLPKKEDIEQNQEMISRVQKDANEDKRAFAQRSEGSGTDNEISQLPQSPYPKCQSIHPLTILQKGNSDPFDSYTIPIKPEVNEVLAFYQKNLLPVFLHYMEANLVPVSAGRAKWHDPFSSLHDKCAAYAFLARTTVIMSRSVIDSGITTRSLIYKTRSLELLRTSLLSGAQLHTPQTYRAILSMLIIAVFEEALEDAAIHAKLLNFLLMRHRERVDVDLGLLFTSVWYDFQRASMSLSRPAFDLRGWVYDEFNLDWTKASSDLPPLSGCSASGLDWCIDDEKLRKLFITFRELKEILGMIALDPSITMPSTLVSLAQYAAVCKGQLIDRYLDVVPQYNNVFSQDPELVHQVHHHWKAYTKAYTCLAALFWTRLIAKEENVPVGSTTTIFNAGTEILPHLRDALTQSNIQSSGLDATMHARLRLWALYVGALGEQSKTGARHNATKSWFRAGFVAQARYMGLILWADVRHVLQRFLYSDSMLPHGSVWFSQTLSAA